jgi:hypothetical protein
MPGVRFLAILLAAAAMASAQVVTAVTVIPALPTPTDIVSIRLDGVNPSGCEHGETVQSSVAGSNVTVTLDYLVSVGPCGQVATPFSVSTVLGVLPAGGYTVTVIQRANGAPVGSPLISTFSVAAPGALPVPAISAGFFVALTAGLIAIGWFRRRQSSLA